MDKGLDNMMSHADAAAHFLKKIANPHRLLILCALSEGEMSVGQLNETVPLSQSALSQHLANLRESNIVTTRREGQTIYYSVISQEALQIIQVLQKVFC